MLVVCRSFTFKSSKIVPVSPESIDATLRLTGFFTIPQSQGDCVALLLVHRGINSLGRYYPPTKVNGILLGDMSRVRALSHNGF